MVSVVIDNVAEGHSPAEMAKDYGIEVADVTAVLFYAAALAGEEVLPVAVGR